MKIDKTALKSRIEQLMHDFVGTRTDTNSEHENNVKEFFSNWFDHIPYFKSNTGHRGLFPIPNDRLQRVVPWALVKGRGDDTVVLIHHCDTVNTEDYKELAHLALEPPKITRALKEGAMELPAHVKKDLDTGDWLFGRGVADMKGGGAMHMALVEAYAEQAEKQGFDGNVLLISLVDEENLSAGMIGAVYLLKELKDRLNLNYVLTIDSEAHERTDENIAINFDGSIGKVMPVVYVRGVLAHTGMIFKGLNPINLLAEIIRRTELSPDFIEKFGNSTCPPPTWLYHKDSKKVYDVSLPDASLGYMSVLTLTKTPKEIMDKIFEISCEAFEQVIADIKTSHAKWAEMSEDAVEPLPNWQTNVKTFAQLYEEAERDSGEEFVAAFKKLDGTGIDSINEIIKTTLSFVRDKSPVVVLALAPPYYPAVNNAMLGAKADGVNSILKEALEHFGDFKIKNIYTGISDLSYAMFISDDDVITYIKQNMMMWGNQYSIPLELIKELTTPILNIGPWGKDIHKYTERVYLPDLYYKSPKVTDFVIRKILAK